MTDPMGPLDPDAPDVAGSPAGEPTPGTAPVLGGSPADPVAGLWGVEPVPGAGGAAAEPPGSASEDAAPATWAAAPDGIGVGHDRWVPEAMPAPPEAWASSAEAWTPAAAAPPAPEAWASAPDTSAVAPGPWPGPAAEPLAPGTPDGSPADGVEGPAAALGTPAEPPPPTYAPETTRATTGDDSGWRPTTRALDGRLARVHLRGGLLTLARASLEQMAGIGALDREALVDLAEARWRSGDLEGAAEAAAAHLTAGGDEPLAHLIVAEQADRQGSLVEARKHASVVRERVGTGLDRLFAGEPRSTAWPMEAIDWMDEGAISPGRWGLLAGGREVAHPEPSSWRMLPPPVLGSPLPRTRPTVGAGTGSFAVVSGTTGTMPVVVAPGPAGPPVSTLERIDAGRAAGAELDLAEGEIALGALAQATERLALVLRFDAALAPVVLSSADRALVASGGRHPALAAIHLLRGDAYRALGREMEAVEAYQESLGAIAARGTNKESV